MSYVYCLRFSALMMYVYVCFKPPRIKVISQYIHDGKLLFQKTDKPNIQYQDVNAKDFAS